MCHCFSLFLRSLLFCTVLFFSCSYWPRRRASKRSLKERNEEEPNGIINLRAFLLLSFLSHVQICNLVAVGEEKAGRKMSQQSSKRRQTQILQFTRWAFALASHLLAAYKRPRSHLGPAQRPLHPGPSPGPSPGQAQPNPPNPGQR